MAQLSQQLDHTSDTKLSITLHFSTEIFKTQLFLSNTRIFAKMTITLRTKTAIILLICITLTSKRNKIMTIDNSFTHFFSLLNIIYKKNKQIISSYSTLCKKCPECFSLITCILYIQLKQLIIFKIFTNILFEKK